MKTKTILLFTLAILAITATIKAQNIPSYIPTNGLVGWWPFNGNANDESGNGNDGTVNGATLTTDRFGIANKAYNFDGIDDFIEVATSNGQFDSQNFSLSFWLKMSDVGSSANGGYNVNPAIISRLQNSSSGNAVDNFVFYEIISGMMFNTNNNGGGGMGAGSLQQNIWINVIVTRNDGLTSFYKNSQLTGSQFNNNNFVYQFYPIRFGRSSHTYWKDFSGELDDVSFWNRALTQEEITALYTASSTNNNATSFTTTNVPGAISYQAVARDAQGAPLADANLQVQFTLIADSLSGTAEYVETHTLTTNSLGLFTTAFGAGTPVSNTFENINWTTGHKFLQVQIDTGNGWMDMGTQQLLSTPYSMHSATSGAIKNPGLPVFADNAAALAGGLVAGDMYRTASGDLKIVY